MEDLKNCEHCRYFNEHKTGVFLADGLCFAVRKNPKPVRKWFKGCKYFTKRKED